MNRWILMLLSVVVFMPVLASADLPSYTEAKTAFSVAREQPQFVLALKSNPSTGYAWYLAGVDNQFVEVVGHEMVPSHNKKLIGAGGVDRWTFTMKPEAFRVPNLTLIHLMYMRPWEEQGKEVVFRVASA